LIGFLFHIFFFIGLSLGPFLPFLFLLFMFYRYSYRSSFVDVLKTMLRHLKFSEKFNNKEILFPKEFSEETKKCLKEWFNIIVNKYEQ